HPARLPPPPPPGPPQQATGQTGAPQAAARKSYAEAYVTPNTTPRRPPVPMKDPYEPLGVRVGTFLLKPSVEVTRGFDSNPSRAQNGASSPYTVVAPELQLRSEWSRHEWNATLRGSYSTYDKDSSLDRPQIDGKTNGRFDVTRDTSIVTEGRLFVSTDNPGSPNVQAGLARLPIYASYGSSVGLVQRFNRLELTVKGGMDSTRFQKSELTDGTTSSNRDRDYDQYSGQFRASYEVMPGIRPFVELGADVRRHALSVDRNGVQRDSRAWTPRAGTTFELTRTLTGEVSAGY
ncbi:MAG: hypothetical protein FJX62_10015, partial [Alphaproteobacteria bacterium]|nr:hypothetical protein [Alphaproteobacteria bacterium]